MNRIGKIQLDVEPISKDQAVNQKISRINKRRKL